MKTLEVKYAEELNNKTAIEISSYLDKNRTYQYLDMLNWPAKFPYKPDCKFNIAFTDTMLWIQYHVREKSVRAVCTHANEPVWEDSCVEFFCRKPNENAYYNFEFNCIGTCLASYRRSKTDVILMMDDEQIGQITRYASLGASPFSQKEGFFEWKLVVGIPFSLMQFDPINGNGLLEANFYKCGGKTSDPHFLSWSYISSAEPDFHRPEYFGKLLLLED